MIYCLSQLNFFFFFLNDRAPTEIYPLPLHDALPIPRQSVLDFAVPVLVNGQKWGTARVGVSKKRMEAQIVRTRSELAGLTLVMLLFGAVSAALDRKSTRLNSSHSQISYAVFCLKKKK